MGCGDSKQASQPSGGKPAGAGNRSAAVSKSLNLRGVLEQTGDVRDFYTFSKVLGKGNFGVVHLVHDKRDSKPYACKSISKRKLVSAEDVEDVRREVQILLHLAGHKNVVQIYGAFEDKSYIHLVMECCAGGELFDRIADQGHFSERAAAEVMRTLVSVVNHCHTMNVIHRDLKPENFLLSSKGKDAVLKATDFGLSRFFKEGEPLDEIVGSPFYVAPEVLQRKYGKEADIWSCGVILYILLCGFPPFHGDTEKKIFESVISKPLDFQSDPWPKISEPAKDCVRRMLQRDPKRRATAAQILQHEWMRENGVASDKAIEMEVLARIRKFSAGNRLKKEAIKLIGSMLPADEINGLREMFMEIDEDKSGAISAEEFAQALRKKGNNLPEEDIQRIIRDADIDGDGTIDYEEFIAATINQNKLEREEHLKKAFEHFDLNGDGMISHDELVQSLSNLGIKEEQVKDIVKQVDTDGDGSIDYNEFCCMIRDREL
uniref:Calcium-dependent protein kinase n=1 Tax=Chlamydomonas euryale TaxID=1486919 RepID=A0A7R9VP03_9CHLO|mmetsp:Transcript_41010/g.122428  ORF Transcript_41010/g.122428 Transcript_41010/m.122428 type:complete len:489 (+) Transcript_41010:210-1676(+)